MASILKYGALTALGVVLAVPVMAQNVYNSRGSQSDQTWNTDQNGNRYSGQQDRVGSNEGSQKAQNDQDRFNAQNGQYGESYNQGGNSGQSGNRFGSNQNQTWNHDQNWNTRHYGSNQPNQESSRFSGAGNRNSTGGQFGENRNWNNGMGSTNTDDFTGNRE